MSRIAPRQLALVIAVASFGAMPALADTTLPTGGTVAAGSASIGTAGSAMTIHQSSQRAVVRWNSFSIGNEASVTFVQPNSTAIALNKVLGTDLSRIDGQLNANGQVFIVNPNGILFGAGSQVNVGGLVASTLGIDDDAFMAGNQVFSGNALAAVVNEGSITAGNVALVGAAVINKGSIVTDGGATVLAAGERVTIAFDGDGLITASVDTRALAALVDNGGVIDVGNGRLLMTTGAAQALGLGVVNNSGVLRATSLEGDGGEIVLSGDAVINSGSIDAGTGGSVLLTGNVVVSAAASVNGDATVTAPIVIDPQDIGPVALAAQIKSYAAAHFPALAALMDSGAIDVPVMIETLQGTDLAAFLNGSLAEPDMALAFNHLLQNGGIDLAAVAAAFDGPALAALLGEVPADNPWLQTAVRILEADAIDPVAIVPLVTGELLAKLASRNFGLADAVGLLGSLVRNGAVNINAVVAAFTPEQVGQLVGHLVGPAMSPLASSLVSSGALDLNKAVTSLSATQWQGLIDGSLAPASLFTTLIASGAINLNTPAGQSLLATVFGGKSPVATPPAPKPKPVKLTFQQKMKLMMAKLRERMKAMQQKRKRT